MGTVVAIIIAVVVIVGIVAVAMSVMQRRKAERERTSEELRDRFGPEYDRAVQEYGRPDTAESMLQSRQERVQALDIRPLSDRERDSFSDSWQSVQTQFVDDPAAAVGEADGLVRQVMETRGYPVGQFEQQASNISVDHPQVVENYRAAHRIALLQQEGHASTEDLRQAMVHYRALFQELLEAGQNEPAGAEG